MNELNSKARTEAELHRQREELVSKHQIGSERAELSEAVQRETEDLQ
jgi:hypothetical protein